MLMVVRLLMTMMVMWVVRKGVSDSTGMGRGILCWSSMKVVSHDQVEMKAVNKANGSLDRMCDAC